MQRTRWSNWAGNQVAAPLRIHQPKTEEELVSVVRYAVDHGERVKAVGSGHSFTSIALTDGHLIELDDYNSILEEPTDQEPLDSSDEPTRGAPFLLTVQSGIRLADLNSQLWTLGYSMTNLGDVAYQSISGAIATATHGT